MKIESHYVFFLRKLFEKKSHDSNDIDILWPYWKKNIDCDDMNCKPYLKDTDGPGDMHKAALDESFMLIIQEMQ